MNNYFRMSAIAIVLSLGSQVATAAQDADDFLQEGSQKFWSASLYRMRRVCLPT